jgi:hypothetical protein
MESPDLPESALAQCTPAKFVSVSQQWARYFNLRTIHIREANVWCNYFTASC